MNGLPDQKKKIFPDITQFTDFKPTFKTFPEKFRLYTQSTKS